VLQTEFVEEVQTHVMFNKYFSENCFIYVTVWKNAVELERPRLTIWHSALLCMLD